jgi:nucleoside-diphosphate-sugar epimerase
MPVKRVLVSGAGGFIGRASVPALQALGYEVHAVVSPGGAARVPAELAPTTVHAADLLDGAAVAALLAAIEPSHLLHFAWVATPGVYWTSPDNARWLAASELLLGVFRRSGGIRAVMAGSCAEYDWSRVEVCHETSSPLATQAASPPTPYAAAKIAMQESLESFGRKSGISTAWGRIFFQYGPHENAARLVPTIIISLLQNREALCSHGRQVRSFLHVADVGAAFAALLDSRLVGPVNVGSGEAVSIGELALRIGAQLGRRDLVRLGAKSAPPGEPAVLIPDLKRLTQELGWQPRFTLEAGLADTIAWWRGQDAGKKIAP